MNTETVFLLLQIGLSLAIASPILGFALTILTPKENEDRIAKIASFSSLINVLAVFGLFIAFLLHRETEIKLDSGMLAHLGSYELMITWIVDKCSLTYSGLTGFFASLVATYSRYYLHREQRYKSFFLIFHLFVFGLMLLSFGGNFSLLFAGWEFISIASFVLIAFYNDREQPVRAALFVLGIYRFCDLGLIFAIVLSHNAFIPDQSSQATWVGFGLLLAASGKSAQFPFSNWLRRAMEGPTPSSAIFYGALSVHAGAFLLLRIAPMMEPLTEVRVATATIGVVSAVIATFVGRTESNIKARIGWAAITQVGLIFCEIAAGFDTLALLHLAANATLRCYQLLVSPSVVAALLKEQSSLKAPEKLNDFSFEVLLPGRLRSSLYSIAISQAYTDQIFDYLIFRPLRKLSKSFHFFSDSLPFSHEMITLVTLTLPALFLLGCGPIAISFGFLIVAVLTYGMAAHNDGKDNALRTWFLIGSIQIAIGITLYIEHESSTLAVAQVLSALACLAAGLNASKTPRKRSSEVIFFCATLMMVGYPIGIPFIAEDVLVHHFINEQLLAALALGLSCSLSGWTAIRAFVYIFWEPSEIHNNGQPS